MPVSEHPHREMVEFVSNQLSTHRLCLVPRGCWKTSVNAIAYPLWRVLRANFLHDNPNHRVLIDSATVRLSSQILRTIARYCKNSETLVNLFGEVYDRKGHTAEELRLAFSLNKATGIKEPNFHASGVGGEKTGQHYEDIILDDLVTEQNYRTPLGRETVFNHYRYMNAIIESSEKEGQSTTLTINGTRWHDDDLYGRLIKDDKKAIEDGEMPIFTTLLRQAIDPVTGALYFPSKLTEKVLAEKKRKMGSLFHAQYQNDPNQDSAPFKPEWLKWESPTSWSLSQIRMTVDLAVKEEEVSHGDYTAIVVAGWDHFYQLHVLDVTMSNSMTMGRFFDEFFRLLRVWDVELVIIEDDHANALRTVLLREMTEHGLSVPIFWQKNPKNIGKAKRWEQIQPYAERGGIKLSDRIPGATKIEIIDEWERAPFATHDDFMDALALHTVRLPVEIEEGTGRGVMRTEGRPVAELMKKYDPSLSPFHHSTLADRFPHIKALQLEEQAETRVPPNELNVLREELMAAFRNG
jgi:hypothetical protein